MSYCSGVFYLLRESCCDGVVELVVCMKMLRTSPFESSEFRRLVLLKQTSGYFPDAVYRAASEGPKLQQHTLGEISLKKYTAALHCKNRWLF